MPKLKAVIPFVAAFMFALLAGFLAGRGYGAKSTCRSQAQADYAQQTRRVQQDVRVLRCLRTNNQFEAMSMLERDLDEALAMFTVRYAVTPQPEKPQYVFQAIGVAQGYRASYPWTNEDQELGEVVQRVFSLGARRESP